MHLFDDMSQRPRFSAAASLAVGVAALLLGLWGLGPVAAVAQVQIEQVESTTQQVEGATQGEVIVAAESDVGRRSVLDLIPDAAPAAADANGSSAAVFQRGDDNNVIIRQAGTNNEASASQLGDDNRIVITQDGAGADAVPSAFDDGEPAADAAFGAIRDVTPVGSGTGNLAVAVHEGTGNRTGILQRGTDNRAGIRLVGDNNTMNLVQTGDDNEYLMDVKADGMERTVVQNGDSNVLDTTVPVNAEMNGNGIEMTIRRDAFGPVSLE